MMGTWALATDIREGAEQLAEGIRAGVETIGRGIARM